MNCRIASCHRIHIETIHLLAGDFTKININHGVYQCVPGIDSHVDPSDRSSHAGESCLKRFEVEAFACTARAARRNKSPTSVEQR